MSKYIEKRDGKWWVVNPVDPDENFADKWNEKPELEKSFRNWLHQARANFNQILKNNNTINESIDLLGRSLGPTIVGKLANQLGYNQNGFLSSIEDGTVPIPTIGDTKHVIPPSWNEDNQYNAKIKGTVYLNKRKKLWMMRNDVPVPKNIWLQFKLETNARPPYEVKWQVVNTGIEAHQANQLRGEFYDSDSRPNNVRWEWTSFRGTHWVEAFVIKHGVCVARSERKYVKIR